MRASADISYDGWYRYTLTREWGPTLSRVVFVMLNPSTADAEKDDPTIRRCINFAKAWDYDGLVVINLFALRATKPDDLLHAEDPRGPDNRLAWDRVLSFSGNRKFVCAWGVRGQYLGADTEFCYTARCWGQRLYCLAKTKHGSPQHPLYVRRETALQPYP